MKQTIIALLIVFGLSFSVANAQSYSLNKKVYNAKEYIPQPGDPNNPLVSGLASFFLPGLGQALSGEVGRGLAFFGGSVACIGVTMAGALQNVDANIKTNNYEPTTKGLGLMLAGALGYTAIGIWSVFDAVNVAKVNNMYIQDKKGQLGCRLELNPYFDTNTYLGQTSGSAGLSMKITF